MCNLRLVAALCLVLVTAPLIAVPAQAGSDAPRSWQLLYTVTAPTPGLHEETFTILPDQDFPHYTLKAYHPETGIGAAVFQVNQAGLAEVYCRGVLADLPISGVSQHCHDLRPNHSYRIIFTTSDPLLEVRIYGW